MTEVKPDECLDCVGLFCPQPLFQTKQAIESLKPGQILEILADDPAAEEDIKRFARRTGHVLISVKRLPDGIQRILLQRKEG
ncbi:MAG: sulfurtransferase TusA family protein [Candidatus Thorarchaeota archaeon]|nr:sulfurtransferase TusA family protein [Candidatus Thorarchaeota archaeon]